MSVPPDPSTDRPNTEFRTRRWLEDQVSFEKHGFVRCNFPRETAFVDGVRLADRLDGIFQVEDVAGLPDLLVRGDVPRLRLRMKSGPHLTPRISR